MIPFIGWFIARRSGTDDGLTKMRTTFLALLGPLVYYLAAFAFVVPWDGGGEGWTPVVVAVLGAACLVGVVRFNRRPSSTESPECLAESYRSPFFICVGLAEASALFGICGIFIGGSLWIYLVGLPFALAGFALIAPTRRNIERRQQEIRLLGSPLSLGQALMDSTPPGRN